VRRVRLHQPWLLAFGLVFIAEAGLKLVLGHGDASDRTLFLVVGAVWCAAAFRGPNPPIPDRWLPPKDPDDYR
jgi:hypothetical protein